MLKRLSDLKTSAVIALLIFGIFASAPAFAAAPQIASVSFSVPKTVGGSKLQGLVSLTSAAPIGGVVVSLRSDNPAVILPRSTDLSNPGSAVTIEAGRTSASFTISTTPVDRDAEVEIVAGTKEQSSSGRFVIEAPVMKTFTLAAPTVVGGQSVRGTVTLNGPAPPSGMRVSPSVEGGKVASVPATLEIRSGQSSATFDVTTSSVSGDTRVTVSTSSSTGASLSNNLTVTLPLVPELTSMTAPSLVSSTDEFEIKLTFDRTLTAGLLVSFTSSNPAVLPELSSRNVFGPGQLSFFTRSALVLRDAPVTITAVSGASTKTANVTVLALKLELGAASNSMTGGASTTGTLAMNLPRGANTIVTLESSSAAIAFPSSLTLTGRTAESNPASLTFDIFSQPVASQTTVTITASSPVTDSKTFQVTVNPTTIAALTLTTTRCDLARNCPNSVGGTVTLASPAPSEGMSVALSSSRSYLSVPTSILIPSGSTTATFNASLASNASSGPVTITATAGSASTRGVTLELVKTFLAVDSLSLSAPEGQGGSPITGTITVRQGVAFGSTVTTVSPSDLDTNVRLLASSGGNFNVGSFSPAAITVPRGQTTATFTFTPLAVAADKPIEIQASAVAPLGAGGTQIVPFTVKTVSIQSMSLSQSTAQGGQEVSGTVQMTGPVPFGNAVTVTSNNPGAATIVGPSFFSSPSSGTFQVNTSADVASSTPVTLTASFNGQSATANLTVERRSLLSNVVLPAARILGGFPTSVRIELDGPAPRNAVVSLGEPLNLIRFVSNQVTVPEGQNFLVVETTPSSQPSRPQQVFVSASYLQQSKLAAVTVEPLSVDVCQSIGSNFPGGTTISCSVSIVTAGMLAPASGIQFSVSNDNPAVASMPGTLTIPGGSSSATLMISTQPVTEPAQLRIGVDLPGSGRSRFFTLTPQ